MPREKTRRLKIVAAPIGGNGRYRAWPDKKTYVRHFATEGRRDDYWRRFILPKSVPDSGLGFQIAMVNEWAGGWEFVSVARYAEEPLIAKVCVDPSIHIVECGAVAR